MEIAVEGSTYIVNVSFVDESDAAMVPVDASWSLRDNTGAIVNSRSNVPLVPATSMSIVLGGDDLEYEENSKSSRILTVVGTYDGTYGSGLPIAEEFTFDIRPLEGIS